MGCGRGQFPAARLPSELRGRREPGSTQCQPERLVEPGGILQPAPRHVWKLCAQQPGGAAPVNIDFSVIKSFRIAEKQNLEFRTEMFNAPTMWNWALPPIAGGAVRVRRRRRISASLPRPWPRCGRSSSRSSSTSERSEHRAADVLPVWWGGQSCPQPPFRRLFRVFASLRSRSRRLKAGCSPAPQPSAYSLLCFAADH